MKKVKVLLTNRYAKIIKPYPIEEFQYVLRYRPPGYYFSPKYRRFYKNSDGELVRQWDGFLSLIKYSKVGTGLFLHTKEELKEVGQIRFKIKDRRIEVEQKEDRKKSDRTYQNECIEAMLKCKHGGLVLKATGTGKTLTTGLFFRRVVGNVVFVVDELTLMEQAREELEKVTGERVGIVGNGKFKPRRVTVATVQTLHKHRNKKEFIDWADTLDVMVIDEIHTQINKRNIDTVKKMSPKMVIGLTATLELNKKPVRYRVFALAGEPIYEYPLEQGVKESFLSPGVVVSVRISQGSTTVGYQDQYKELIVESKTRNKAITSLARECYEDGRSIIIIVERVKHLKKLSKLLSDIPHRTVYGAREVVDRIKAKKDFDKKKVRLLIVNKVFKKGISINAIDTIIECAALKSKNDVIQKYGRGIRLCKEKKGLIYFDISDTDNRFEKGTKSRLRALKARQIPIIKEKFYEQDPEDLLQKGIELLDKTVRKLKKAA